MCGIANLQRIERKIKRRANRKPVHWVWQVAMLRAALDELAKEREAAR